MNPQLVSRVVFLSALYDLAVTLPFATPWTARLVLQQLTSAHHQLGLSGAAPQLVEPIALLFVSLMGSLVVVWSGVRLLSPTAPLGAADTLARLLFSTWMLHALAHGGSWVVVPFVVAEVAWGLVQGAVVLPVVWRGLGQRAQA
ncbi:MAG: hypothetical protein IAE78_24355 [Myxococcus sp.]|nr:hypothetical protein [Myxococcus sp.]